MIRPMRVSSSTTESAYLLLDMDLWIVVRVRQVRLMHLHEVDVDEERLCPGLLDAVVEEFERRLFHVAVKERNANDAVG